jgi:hypothetical protein
MLLEIRIIQVGLPRRDQAAQLFDLPETLVLQSVEAKKQAPDWKEANSLCLAELFK